MSPEIEPPVDTSRVVVQARERSPTENDVAGRTVGHVAARANETSRVIMGLVYPGMGDGMDYLYRGIVGALALSVVWSTWRDRWKLVGNLRDVLSHLRWYMPFEVVPVLTVTCTVGVCLTMWVPWMAHGWFYYLLGGDPRGDVNLGFALGYGTAAWLAVPFLGMLGLGIPTEARKEEEMFRAPIAVHGDRYLVFQAVFFGPLHCMAGVPPAFGVALIVAGLFFGWKFRGAYRAAMAHPLEVRVRFHDPDVSSTMERAVAGRHGEAVREALSVSTAYHAVWNWTAVSLLLAAVVAG